MPKIKKSQALFVYIGGIIIYLELGNCFLDERFLLRPGIVKFISPKTVDARPLRSNLSAPSVNPGISIKKINISLIRSN